MTMLEENPNLYAVVILVAALLIGAAVDLIVTRVIRRLVARTKTTLDDVVIDSVRRPLFVTVLFGGLGMAVTHLAPSESVLYVTQALLISVAVLMWSGAFFKSGKAVLAALAGNHERFPLVNTRTIPLFDIAIKTVVVAGASYGVLLAWDVDVTAWLASAGVLGIAIGFAAKDTLANLFSGIFILADAPYKLGDFINLDSGERGQVVDIGIRSTRLLTRDDIQIIVPNAAIANSKIVNETGGPHDLERIRVNIGVAYGSDVDQVREVLMKAAREATWVINDRKDIEPRVRFRTFGDAALNFQLMGWIEEPVLRGRALDDLNQRVYEGLVDAGIEIPYPQIVVHRANDGE